MAKGLLKWLVLATVMNAIFIMLVSCGGISSTRESFRTALPSVNSIKVRALYPRADIRTILDSVAPPLKDAIFQHV